MYSSWSGRGTRTVRTGRLPLQASGCNHIHLLVLLQVERLQQQVVSLQDEADMLRPQLLVTAQDKLSHAQEVTELHRKLREALSKVRLAPPLTV